MTPLLTESPLLNQHRELERDSEALLTDLDCDDPIALREHWKAFETLMTNHMEIEEQELLPRLAVRRPDEAATLRGEHQWMRAAFVDLGVRLDLHLLRAGEVCAFIQQIRAHMAREEAAFRAFV